ncbi:hypothetical protein K439DRAFT_1635630, partial [Ramaria rubella]
MSHMQIDFPSPSPMRHIIHKRPRSPASPSPLERPSKRLSRDSVGRSPSELSLPGYFSPHAGIRPGNAQVTLSFAAVERRTSEDWVAKTSGLKLNSPLCGFGQGRTVPLPRSENAGMDPISPMNSVNQTHETMMTDEPSLPNIVGHWSSLSTPNHCTVAPYRNWDISDTPHSPFLTSLPSTEHPPVPPTTLPHHSDIRIHIQPATPSNHQRRSSAAPRHSQPSPMSISPANCAIWSPNSPARKPRVTMGPRPDCEKCRMGVKGHWMHI